MFYQKKRGENLFTFLGFYAVIDKNRQGVASVSGWTGRGDVQMFFRRIEAPSLLLLLCNKKRLLTFSAAAVPLAL